jgi:Amt family ammonium transporter
MAMNFMIYILGLLGFWICGFAFMFGGFECSLWWRGVTSHEVTLHIFGHDFGIIGSVSYFLSSDVYDVGIFALFLFQMVLWILQHHSNWRHGRRWKFKAFMVYGFFISMFVYPICGSWVWEVAGWHSWG